VNRADWRDLNFATHPVSLTINGERTLTGSGRRFLATHQCRGLAGERIADSRDSVAATRLQQELQPTSTSPSRAIGWTPTSGRLAA
jgi:hypothetical protein